MENKKSVRTKVPQSLQVYGALFSVTNRIQSEGDFVSEGITMRQQFLLILLSLFEDYAPTLQELAEVFGSSYQNVKRMASQLETQKYLEIKKDAIDRRKIRLHLNKKNFAALEQKSFDQMEEFMKRIFKNIDAETLGNFRNCLFTIEDNLQDVEE